MADAHLSTYLRGHVKIKKGEGKSEDISYFVLIVW